MGQRKRIRLSRGKKKQPSDILLYDWKELSGEALFDQNFHTDPFPFQRNVSFSRARQLLWNNNDINNPGALGGYRWEAIDHFLQLFTLLFKNRNVISVLVPSIPPQGDYLVVGSLHSWVCAVGCKTKVKFASLWFVMLA